MPATVSLRNPGRDNPILAKNPALAPALAATPALAASPGLAASPALAAHDRRAALARSDPLLALAYWIEAAADRRVEADVMAPAVLTDMRDRARRAIERHTAKPFHNPLYPTGARS